MSFYLAWSFTKLLISLGVTSRATCGNEDCVQMMWDEYNKPVDDSYDE